MEKKKKSMQHYARSLHRNIGYLIAGMTIIFILSGIVQIYRDTDFLKIEKNHNTKIEPQLSIDDLGKALRLKGLKAEKQEGDILYFKNGTYNIQTGEAIYTSKELPMLLGKFEDLHKSASKKAVHLFTLIYAILLLLLVVSSFWMYKPNTQTFKQGIALVGIGVVIAIILVLLV